MVHNFIHCLAVVQSKVMAHTPSVALLCINKGHYVTLHAVTVSRTIHNVKTICVK